MVKQKMLSTKDRVVTGQLIKELCHQGAANQGVINQGVANQGVINQGAANQGTVSSRRGK